MKNVSIVLNSRLVKVFSEMKTRKEIVTLTLLFCCVYFRINRNRKKTTLLHGESLCVYSCEQWSEKRSTIHLLIRKLHRCGTSFSVLPKG